MNSLIKHFLIPEFKSIAGKNYKNIIVIFIMCFISILAIGIGQGITDYLSSKMQNPFIRFVNIKIPSNSEFQWDILQNNELKKKYHFTSVTPLYFSYIDIANNKDQAISAKVRRISENSEFYKFLVSEKSLMLTESDNTDFSDNGYGIIVTSALIKKLGFDDIQHPYLKMVHYIKNQKHFIPFPVIAVVSQLPDYVDVLISKKLYTALINSDELLDITNFIHSQYYRFYAYCQLTSIETERLLENGFTDITSIESPSATHGQIFEKLGVNDIKFEENFINQIISDSTLRLYDLDRVAIPVTSYSPQLDILSLSFKDLDSIYVFRDYLKENFDIEIDMNTIESKRSFHLFNNNAKFLSLILVIFSILGVILFVSNIVLAHIEKNKKNLGTLMAFGLTNNMIVLIYSLLALSLIGLSVIFSYSICLLVGNGLIKLFTYLLQMDIPSQELYFSSYSIAYLFIFYIFVPIVTISLNLWFRIYRQTPSDFINERV